MATIMLTNASSNAVISRRATRIGVGEESTEVGNLGQMAHELRGLSGDEQEKDNEKLQIETRSASLISSTSSSVNVRSALLVDVGRNLGELLPTTAEDMEKQGTYSPHLPRHWIYHGHPRN